MHRRTALAGIGAACLTGLPAHTRAQGLATTPGPFLAPGRQLRFTVGYPAGGVADFAARTVAEGVAQATGVTALVENRVGAGGNIAMEYVARQPADNPMIGVFANSIVTTNPFVPQLTSKTTDALKDMVPVSAIADMVLVLAVSSNLGVETLDQFLAKARTPGQRLKIGLAGSGTPHHLAALLLERSAALDMTLVPYKGGAPMIVDAAGGHIDAVFTTIPVGSPMVAAGKLRWIAVAQPKPVRSLPGIPSLVGVYKGATVPSWIGAFASAHLSSEALNAFNETLNAAANSPAIASKLVANGLEPLSLTRAQTIAKVNDEAVFMKDFLGKIKVDFSA